MTLKELLRSMICSIVDDVDNVKVEESTTEKAPKTYSELDQSLINMEPHFFLNKVLIKRVIFCVFSVKLIVAI